METLVRGPVYRGDSKGEEPLYPDGATSADQANYEHKLKRWREIAREEAYNTAQLNPEREHIQRYVAALQGDWWDRKRARYKSRIFDNRMNNARRQDLALLTDTRPTIDVVSTIPAYQEDGQIVANILHSEWWRQDMDLSLVQVADISMLAGTGFWKIGATSPGNTYVIPCGPEAVMPIQPGFHIQQSTAVLYRTWKALHYFKTRFPFQYAGLEREVAFNEMNVGGETHFNRPSDYPEYVWNGLSPAMKRAVGVRTEAQEIQTSPFRSLELQEFWIEDHSINESPHKVLMRHPWLSLEAHNWWYWVRPGQRLYPRKRLIVFAGRKLMYDGPSPYWHGMYPFSCLRMHPVPWSFWGLSKYRDLLPLNRALNEIAAGVMDMVQRALNPIAITKAGAVPLPSWREFYPDMPGGRLYMLPNANIATDLRYMDPPNIPQWVLLFHQYVSAEHDRLSGAVDVGAMSRKKQMPGGDSIEQMRDAQSIAQRLDGRYFEAFLRDSGVLAMSNVFQYYKLPMRLRLLGGDGISWSDMDTRLGELIPQGVQQEDHWRQFSMRVTPGSLHGGAKDREKQIAMNLSSRHLIPIKLLYKVLELGDPNALYQELVQEHQQLGMQIGSGRRPRTDSQKRGQAV